MPAAAPSTADVTILCTEYHAFMFVGSVLTVAEINLLVGCNRFNLILLEAISVCVDLKYILRIIQSNPDTKPLFVNSWRYVEGDKIPKYCVLRNSVRKLSRALSESGAISGFDCNLLCIQAFHEGDYMINALWNVSSCSLVNGSKSF